MMIRTVIVDDEPLARRRVLSLLKSDSSFEVLAECGDGASAILAITQHRPDLVFLDVQIPEMDGFGILEAVAPTHLPAVVFVTAYEQYAVRAFDECALDYLLKPFKRDRFFRSLERVKATLSKSTDASDERKLLSLLRHVSRDRGRLVVRTGGKILFLRNSEVEWIEAAANYVKIHSARGVYPVRDRISDFEHSLAPDRFLRIHRSFIVYVDAISEIQSCGGGEQILLLRSGKELPVGRSYRASLEQLVKKSVRGEAKPASESERM